MKTMKGLYLIGYASGIAGVNPDSSKGPIVIRNSSLVQSLPIHWDSILQAPTTKENINEKVKEICQSLANTASQFTRHKQFFIVLGGDHTAAIGTWSGAYDALHSKGDLGLIWIDAHMDAHTPETTLSGNLHGMPLACLLGYGDDKLTSILHPSPKLKPENVCLIGVRSFEAGERKLLEKLNVRIYFMDEVKKRGFETVLQEAIVHVNRHTIAYGISFDLDSLDPEEAPGVDCPVPHGIKVNDFMRGISSLINDQRLIALEIVEFNPVLDQRKQTEKIIVDCLKCFAHEV